MGAAILWRLEQNGWGTLVWLATCITVKRIRAPFEKDSKEETFLKHHQAGIDTIIMLVFLMGGGIIPMAHLATGVLAFANYPLPVWAPALSFLGLVPGVVLFRASHVDLGRNWSVATELREGHILVTTGVYKHVRHPMYSALWLIFSTYPLLLHNWIAGLSSVAGFAVLYSVRVPYEERMMHERFGEEYASYMQRSGRLWPPLRPKAAHQQ